MKKINVLFAMLLVAGGAMAQTTWTIDKSHSRIGFSVPHYAITEVEGNFKDFDASVVSKADDFAGAEVTFTAKTASIDTDNEKRDGHLKSPDFFDAEKYPTIKFKSTSFKKVEGKKWKMTGNLTIKDVTKPVTLDVTLNGPIENPRSKKMMIGLKASGSIDRFDFGVGGESGAGQSREVLIYANGEFTKE